MTPILYSFRRCPYAIRARLAIAAAGVQVHLREVVLRDKPQAFLMASPSATVPCLVHGNGVIDESLDIMRWALERHDPEAWLDMPQDGWDWIARCDGPFKHALDRVKYASRYPDEDATVHRIEACRFLGDLDRILGKWMFNRPTLADYAILPFVRQFAFIDKPWFDAQDWPNLQDWLAHFLVSEQFVTCMKRFAPWQSGDAPIVFPTAGGPGVHLTPAAREA